MMDFLSYHSFFRVLQIEIPEWNKNISIVGGRADFRMSVEIDLPKSKYSRRPTQTPKIWFDKKNWNWGEKQKTRQNAENKQTFLI